MCRKWSKEWVFLFVQNKFYELVIYKLNYFYQQIVELESELEHEQRNHQESLKETKRNDRRVKDLISQTDEDRHSQARLQEQVEKLNSKVRFYKRQAEESEDVVASSKFRAASAAPFRR